jgi:hypothetical protein
MISTSHKEQHYNFYIIEEPIILMHLLILNKQMYNMKSVKSRKLQN